MSASKNIVNILDRYRNIRDHFDETFFFSIYENPWMRQLYPETLQKNKPRKEKGKEVFHG